MDYFYDPFWSLMSFSLKIKAPKGCFRSDATEKNILGFPKELLKILKESFVQWKGSMNVKSSIFKYVYGNEQHEHSFKHLL